MQIIKVGRNKLRFSFLFWHQENVIKWASRISLQKIYFMFCLCVYSTCTSIKLDREQVKDLKLFLSPGAAREFIHSIKWIWIECSSRCRMHKIAFLESKMHSCVLSAACNRLCALPFIWILRFFKKFQHTEQQHVSCLRDGTFEMRISHIASEPPALFIAHTHTHTFHPDRDHLKIPIKGVSHL